MKIPKIKGLEQALRTYIENFDKLESDIYTKANSLEELEDILSGNEVYSELKVEDRIIEATVFGLVYLMKAGDQDIDFLIQKELNARLKKVSKAIKVARIKGTFAADEYHTIP